MDKGAEGNERQYWTVAKDWIHGDDDDITLHPLNPVLVETQWREEERERELQRIGDEAREWKRKGIRLEIKRNGL